ncbi:hypothetical protein ACPCHT_32255, partial [Nucisporomicrobium flavum]|uniref:hypothetical protein n=1 Tax=Nucisporomicrobium flavum TaxID=2785915 RepID=UPI003C2BA925
RRGTSSVQPQMPPPHDQSIMFEKLRESGGNSDGIVRVHRVAVLDTMMPTGPPDQSRRIDMTRRDPEF